MRGELRVTSEEMAVKIAAVECRAKSNTRRIEKLEQATDAIHSLAESIAVLVSEQQSQTGSINRIERSVETLDEKVEALERRPGKKWDRVLETAVTLIVGAVVALVLTQIGLG